MRTKKVTNLALENKDISGIHYNFKTESYGVSLRYSSDRWSKTNENELTVFYEIAESETLLDSKDEFAIFHSGSKWNFIDDELATLKIKPEETIIIKFKIVATETPDIPLFMQIMTYPKIEAIGALLLITGFMALTAAVIALIVAATASMTIMNPFGLAIIGAIVFTIGLTMVLATRHCQNQLDEAPWKLDAEVTMEQDGVPESRKSVSAQTQKRVFHHFFSKMDAKVHFEETDSIGLSAPELA
ncbi:hypothetical protein BN59_00048 [Legionella massiliensis]|uniref:Uncharacterized protein n=1 Tax=Legionella massiliensis TaxID=1034943 RepID=A0A078KN48_9GAMM|nr:hypothetical protein [Legionella massiliensis]CDZ75790.1 hypothetical protein BN59_00048 [Legionella massiliensis]CEE11528.1 hypothetical protein BN1094_00048 [Legionella massiliensis]